MTTKIICDKCEKEIDGYMEEYNQIKIRRFISNQGGVSFIKDLCDDCMDKLVEFVEEPSSEILVKWIVQNVSANDVPGDEGNGEGLIYNLVHHVLEGPDYRHFDYEPEQNLEIEQLLAKYNKE